MTTSKGKCSPEVLKDKIAVAKGEKKASVVITGAKVLDVYSGEWREGDVAIYNDTIIGLFDSYEADEVIDAKGKYIVPGFIDSHVHIESSMMTPARFQQAVLPCGTTSVVWDPHEIANVLGTDGIKWALDSSEGLDLDVFVMVPSCVPSTSPEFGLETSGATLKAEDIRQFKDHPRVAGLAEMMNFPGLLMGDPDIMAKLNDYHFSRLDGHCPGLTGKDLNAYGVAGIHTCHETTTLKEAEEKLSKGIHVQIREGSCAKNAADLLGVLTPYTSATLAFCSDDRNPADIEAEGHIDCIVNMALKAGCSPVDVFRAASYAAASTFGFEDRGVVAPGFLADLVIVAPKGGDFRSGCEIKSVFKKGKLVKADSLDEAAKKRQETSSRKNMRLPECDISQLKIPSDDKSKVRVIGLIPNQILTNPIEEMVQAENGSLVSDTSNDVLKIAVFERHNDSGGHSVGFVKGFNLSAGAIASSVNHDSHNVIVVGADDDAMVEAVNRLREIDGGIVAVDGKGGRAEIALPIGGLMTDVHPDEVTKHLVELKKLTTGLGCKLDEPFLQLAFLALPVIPAIKITDKGLVDVTKFQIVDVKA